MRFKSSNKRPAFTPGPRFTAEKRRDREPFEGMHEGCLRFIQMVLEGEFDPTLENHSERLKRLRWERLEAAFQKRGESPPAGLVEKLMRA